MKVAAHWIALEDDWTRKLQVGTFLRTGSLSKYRRMKSRILRDKLEHLEHEVEEGDRELTLELCKQTQLAYDRMRRAYLE